MGSSHLRMPLSNAQVSTFQTRGLPKWIAEARSLVAEVFGEESGRAAVCLCW